MIMQNDLRRQYSLHAKEYENKAIEVLMPQYISNAGCIVMPVEPYTYECNTWGFWGNRIEWLLTDYHSGSEVSSHIGKVCEMSENEFCNEVRGTYEKARSYYSMDKVAESFINRTASAEIQESKYLEIVRMRNAVISVLQKNKILNKILRMLKSLLSGSWLTTKKRKCSLH